MVHENFFYRAVVIAMDELRWPTVENNNELGDKFCRSNDRMAICVYLPRKKRKNGKKRQNPNPPLQSIRAIDEFLEDRTENDISPIM